jgi:glycosyltransferase involved in cell wall biosynthesis
VSPDLPRVLFLTTDVPLDGETGGQIASWRVLQAYATFAQVDVLALTPPGASAPEALRELTGNLALVPIDAFHYRRARLRLLGTLARSWLGGPPYRIAKFDRPEVRRIVGEWTARAGYDLVHCERLATTPYADCLPDTPFVFYDYEVESHDLATMADARSNPLARAVLLREARRTRAAEIKAIGRAAHVFAVSDEDVRLLSGVQQSLSRKITVCPVPMPDAQLVARRGPEAFSALVLGPLHAGGRLDGLRWLLSEVWPGFRTEHPDARLLVVGAGAPADIRARDGRDGIEVRGFVEDLDGVLAEADVCLMPLLSGGGIRIKVLELLPRGIPCLGSRVAVRGFAGVAGVYEANLPQEWLKTLGALARITPERARRLALTGADELRPRFSLEATAAALSQACAQATAGPVPVRVRP